MPVSDVSPFLSARSACHHFADAHDRRVLPVALRAVPDADRPSHLWGANNAAAASVAVALSILTKSRKISFISVAHDIYLEFKERIEHAENW